MSEIFTWHDIIDAMPEPDCSAFLRRVLRTRRRAVPVCLNEKTFAVKRAELRDYLRQRSLPRWLRKRPLRPGEKTTITFRRPVPFPTTGVLLLDTRNDALEEAAKACEALELWRGADECAVAIRALKRTP